MANTMQAMALVKRIVRSGLQPHAALALEHMILEDKEGSVDTRQLAKELQWAQREMDHAATTLRFAGLVKRYHAGSHTLEPLSVKELKEAFKDV